MKDIEDLERDDMILLVDEDGKMLYTVVDNKPIEEEIYLYAVQFINGKKKEKVKNTYYNSIKTQYLYQIIKRDGVMWVERGESDWYMVRG